MPASVFESIAAAARAMEDESTPSDTMERALSFARELVPSAQDAGISLRRRGGSVETAAATSDVVVLADKLEYELGEGPCLDAIWHAEVVRSNDIGADERWRRWGPRVVEEAGMRSMLCLRLFTHEDRLGALNLYSQQADAFDDADVEHGLAMAAHSAVALSAALQIEHLRLGMDTRTAIGQAQGIMMERFDMDGAHAFAVLTRLSSHSNRKLREIAVEIIETRRLPD